MEHTAQAPTKIESKRTFVDVMSANRREPENTQRERPSLEALLKLRQETHAAYGECKTKSDALSTKLKAYRGQMSTAQKKAETVAAARQNVLEMMAIDNAGPEDLARVDGVVRVARAEEAGIREMLGAAESAQATLKKDLELLYRRRDQYDKKFWGAVREAIKAELKPVQAMVNQLFGASTNSTAGASLYSDLLQEVFPQPSSADIKAAMKELEDKYARAQA